MPEDVKTYLPEEFALMTLEGRKKQERQRRNDLYESRFTEEGGEMWAQRDREKEEFAELEQRRLENGESRPVEELGLKQRIERPVRRAGIRTVKGLEQVLARGDVPLRVGKEHLVELGERLKSFRAERGLEPSFVVEIPVFKASNSTAD